MSTTKKITKSMRFDDIKALLNGEVPTHGTTIEEAIAVIEREQEILANKNSKKVTKVDENGNPILTEEQKKNEVYKEYILAELGKVTEDNFPNGMTCKELLYAIPSLYNAQYSSQKVAALLRQMETQVDSHKVKGEKRFFLIAK